MTSIDWDALRLEFPGLQARTYLNTVSLGQLSKSSRVSVGRFLDLWETLGSSAWYAHWLGEVEALRQEFAAQIGASSKEIAILPNISSALTAVASSLDYSLRKKVISCSLDFPTITYQWLAKASLGIETRIIPSPDRIGVPLEAFENEIDEQTALVATSRVYFLSGFIQDVKTLSELAHKKGALCLIDDYQATGQVPIDVKETGVDFLLSGSLKWLLGGPSVAYLYVRQDLIPTLHPTVTGWFSQSRQFEFDTLNIEFHKDARRFEAGTPPVPSVFAAKAGLQMINKIGAKNIRQRTSALTQDLVDRLLEKGYQLRIPDRPEQQASITMIETTEAQRITKELAARDIIVDYRPGAVRVSPYFYNTFEENQILVEALGEIM